MKPANRKPVVFGVVAAFLLVIFLQMFLMARDNSATFDEPFHIYAGYLQWKHGYVTLNPPLITRLITLPLIGMNLPEPPIPRLPYEPLGFLGGKALVFQNDANTIMFRARMADSVFTLLLAILVFAAAREMFGLGAGFVALGLIAFDPTLMGHSALATLDSGNAFFMFWAIYAFYRYVKSPTVWRLIGTGLVVGLALAAKHSSILLLPTLVRPRRLRASVAKEARARCSTRPDRAPRLAPGARIGGHWRNLHNDPVGRLRLPLRPSRRRAVQSSHGGATQPRTERV